MSMTHYGKMLYKGRNGKMWQLQPKSYSEATKQQEKETLDLILSGKYVVVPVAMPINNISREE